jgi:hypothetical protein
MNCRWLNIENKDFISKKPLNNKRFYPVDGSSDAVYVITHCPRAAVRLE